MIRIFLQPKTAVCKAPNFSLGKEKLQFGQREIRYSQFLKFMFPLLPRSIATATPKTRKPLVRLGLRRQKYRQKSIATFVLSR